MTAPIEPNNKALPRYEPETMNKINRMGENQEEKYNRNMDWGTPRLVTKSNLRKLEITN